MPKWNYDGEYPNNPPQSAQGDATEAQQAPQATGVESTLEAILLVLQQRASGIRRPDSVSPVVRAHLEALVKAARQEEYDMGSAMARRENRASYDQITYLEAENAKLREALHGCLAATTERERARANHVALNALSPEPEKKEDTNAS